MNELFDSLISEARKSPILLSDLAGLETYISESYTNRSFIELLQNADDAGATKFLVNKYQNFLIVANNGREFNHIDLESLCRSASSSKVRGQTIGYRGIGFKSVVSIATEVHLISGEYEISFSRELTKELIPEASKVPLIRIPHPLKADVKKAIGLYINSLKAKGYSTFFIFSGIKIEQVQEEYENVPYTSLLFLYHIKELNIEISNPRKATVLKKKNDDNSTEIYVNALDNKFEWRIYSDNNCSIAFSVTDNQIQRLNKKEALLHAFLPTEDESGFGAIVNSDFSTDPSRRHIIPDENTKNTISNIAKLYEHLLRDSIFSNNPSSAKLVESLIPYYDYRLDFLMSKTFDKIFVNVLKEIKDPIFINSKLPPKWLNLSDFNKLQNTNNIPCMNENCLRIEGAIPLLAFLGSKELSYDDILKICETAELSIRGYSQIAANGFREIIMNHSIPYFTEKHIFLSNNKLLSLKEINEDNRKIDDSFYQLILDNGLESTDIQICFKKLSLFNLIDNNCFQNDIQPESSLTHYSDKDVGISRTQSSNNNESKELIDWFNPQSGENPVYVDRVSSTKKWRSVEENTLIVLNDNGFKLTDVSIQNLGYDLEGRDPQGEDIYIEVKSVDYQGQNFRMTNNEYAVAQYRKDKYVLAIVHQSSDSIEIGLIKDPIKSLKLNRQCVQWIWECSEYKYTPYKFPLL